jgi:hypothetical protein
MRILREIRKGVDWCISEHLEDLDLSDCICLLGHPFVDMEKKLRDLHIEGKIARLQIVRMLSLSELMQKVTKDKNE